MSLVVTKSRPLGQGSGSARPAVFTARPSVHTVRMVSVVKAAAAAGDPQDGSTVVLLAA